MPFDPFGRPRSFRHIPDPFGRVLPDQKPYPEITDFRNPFHIRRSVGVDGGNDRRDVAKVESLLGRTGDLNLTDTDGVTGFVGLRMDKAIRRFQNRHGLKVDGVATPGGETMGTLQAAIAAAQMADSDVEDGSEAPPKPKKPVLPKEPFTTRDRMEMPFSVPGTLDNNVMKDMLRILKRKRERRA